MAEEIELRHLRDKNGKKIAPFAPEAAIYDEKGMRLSDKLKGLNLNSIRDAQDEALSAIDEKENEAIGNFSSQRVIPDMLSPEVMALIEASGGGTINNMPDGEDLTSKDIAGGKSVMQLADRPYNPSAFSGNGYTILRKNVSALSRGGSANILTQQMISQPNTIYEVRYDFDLNQNTINIPQGCVLKFSGGSISNGLIDNTNCRIIGVVKFENVTLLNDFITDSELVYNSVEDMKNDYNAHGKIRTLGYYSPNDGGGGYYYVKNTGEENGGSIHRLKNGLYAHLVQKDNIYRLKQWGINGERIIRKALDRYTFLDVDKLRTVNAEFDENTTDSTYIIQYLINTIKPTSIIYLDGMNYLVNHTIHLKSWITIIGDRPDTMYHRSNTMQIPPYPSSTDSLTRSSIMVIKESIPMFDSGNEVLQLIVLKNFNAVGTFGKKGFPIGSSNDFFKTTGSSITTTEFYNLGISNFNTMINKNGHGMYWTKIIKCVIQDMQFNGIDLSSTNQMQVNAVDIHFCRFFRCGLDVSQGDDGEIKFTYKQLSKPDITQGNCIVVGGSGITCCYNDVSMGYIGYYVQQYNKSIILGSYSEGLTFGSIYRDYQTKLQQPDSVVVGGYFQIKEKYVYDTIDNDILRNNWNLFPYGGLVYINNFHKFFTVSNIAQDLPENTLDFAFEIMNHNGFDITIRLKKGSSLRSVNVGFINELAKKYVNDRYIDIEARTIGSYYVNNPIKTIGYRNVTQTIEMTDYILDTEADKIYLSKKLGDGALEFAVENNYNIVFQGKKSDLIESETHPGYYEAAYYDSIVYPQIYLSRVKGYEYQYLYNFWQKEEDDEYDYYTFNINALITNVWGGICYCQIVLNQGTYEDIEIVNIFPSTPKIIDNRLLITNNIFSEDSGYISAIEGTRPVAVINDVNYPHDGIKFLYKNNVFSIISGNAYTDDGFKYVYTLPAIGQEGDKIFVNEDSKKYIYSNEEWVISNS